LVLSMVGEFPRMRQQIVSVTAFMTQALLDSFLFIVRVQPLLEPGLLVRDRFIPSDNMWVIPS
jgi:hypothetical protein